MALFRRLVVYVIAIVIVLLLILASMRKSPAPSVQQLHYEETKDCVDLMRPVTLNGVKQPCECSFVAETLHADGNVETFNLFRIQKSSTNSKGRKRQGLAKSPCLCSRPSTIHDFSKENLKDSPKHVFAATLVKNKESWGRGRSIVHHLLMLISNTDSDSHKYTTPITIGLMVSDYSEYLEIVRAFSHLYLSDSKPRGSPVECYVKNFILERLNLQSLFVIYQPNEDAKAGSDRYYRHAIWVQKKRRRNIARLRNQLIANALRNSGRTPSYEQVQKNSDVLRAGGEYDVLEVPVPSHFMWTDADILHIPQWDDIDFMMERSDAHIVTIRCTRSDFGPDYDLNAWSGPRNAPTVQQLIDLRKGNDTFVPFPTEQTIYLSMKITPPQLLEKKSVAAQQSIRRNNWIELDSVGGTFLLVKSQVFIDGVLFPPYNVIGTEWVLSEGWDGIETEGL
ncbi:hypothetical protein HK096_010098, partial [Nowakowskiella sp. JEL0078]